MADEPRFVFAPPVRASIAIAGESARVPIRRVLCVGRNYAAHARELGNDPEREAPFFFFKPTDAVVDSAVGDQSVVPYPPLTKNLHHEIELVVVVGRGGARIKAARALEHVFGYAAGLDLTRRDLQTEARDAGRPWDWAKSFDRCAPCGPVVTAQRVGHPVRARISLSVNGTVKQDADISEMIWGVPEIIVAASEAMVLQPGDVIFTGTPAGVGALAVGDRVLGAIEGIGEVAVTVGEPLEPRSA
jgi:fumarylpyruvate hydrolase